MKEKFIQFQEGNLYYRMIGNGEPILLIHGFAEDGTIWDNLMPILAEKYTVIVPDLPGVGFSLQWKNVPSSIAQYVPLLKQILDNENISTCTMIGHSMGGYITVEFAATYPNSLVSFVLFHSSAFADAEEKVEARKKSITFIQQHGTAEFLKTSIPGLFYDENKSKQYIQDLLEKGKNISPTTLINNYKAMMARKDHRQVLQHFEKPIGFILGQYDKAVPFEQGLPQVSMPIQSQVGILRNSAHMGMLEEKEKSIQLLAAILNEY